MLRALELSNFAIVDSLRIELAPGLNVLTGETGAGKSILLDALALLCGGRADLSMVRSGADSALIQGIFSGTLESASRRLGSNRSSARLNGELVTVSELAQRMQQFVVIHGQHASQLLMSASEQRQLLDAQLPADAQKLLKTYSEGFARQQRIKKELESLRLGIRERARRLDVLQFQLDEIDSARLRVDEQEALDEELSNLRHAERIVQASASAHAHLSEADVNAVELLANASRDLAQAGRYHKTLSSLANELSDVVSSAQAIATELGQFLADFEVEPGRLEQLESRQALIESLQRKYGDSIAAILSYRAEAAAELESLAGSDAQVELLEAELNALTRQLTTQAQELLQARQLAAEQLSARVTKEIQPLGMQNAQFVADVQASASLSASGADDVRFLFSANLGEPLAPLSAVASGGELSRVMLGLNIVTGSNAPIIAFDEVDAGIGGQTARTVGALLKQLAQQHQVLVVTHLPQVAAFADVQFYVEKQEKKGRTVTRVSRLEPHERELELARMLSGATTDAALANARELLAEAQQFV